MCERIDLGDGNYAIVCGGRASHKKKPEPITWPTSRAKLQLAGYHLKYARRCRLCDALIEFWRTPANKMMPLDRRPDDTFTPHHSTCPRVEEFRQKTNQNELFK